MTDKNSKQQGQGETRKTEAPAVSVPKPGEFSLPSRTVQVCDVPQLTTGLHLLLGPRASGKTLTSLGLAHDLHSRGVKVAYRYLLEPRARATRGLLDPDRWTEWYIAACRNLRGGVLILDSMTYVIAMLTHLRDLGEFMSNVTYTGGLSPRDIQGALIHDEIASQHGVCVIATINSELFPVVDKFEGAVEGRITIVSTTVITYRNRAVRRELTYSIPPSAHLQALSGLGYDKSNGASGFSSSSEI